MAVQASSGLFVATQHGRVAPVGAKPVGVVDQPLAGNGALNQTA
jgi:hypothetical protein